MALFIAVDRAIWRGREINRANLYRAWWRLSGEACRLGYTEVSRACDALYALNKTMAVCGREPNPIHTVDAAVARYGKVG